MQFAFDQPSVFVLPLIFRQQMAAVGGGAQQHIVRRNADRTVQHRFKRFVTGVVGFKRQIVAIKQEPFGPVKQRFNDIRQVQQILLIDFDQPQPLIRVFIQHRFDQRRFPRPACPPQQDMIKGTPRQELPNVQIQRGFLPVDAAQIGQPQLVRMAHQLEIAALAEAPPAAGAPLPPVRRLQG